MSDMRLIVAGAGGRMGRTLIKAIDLRAGKATFDMVVIEGFDGKQ